MGSEVLAVVVDGPAAPLLERLADLEQRWSRFRPDSELCRLGGRGGAVVVSPETALLVECARWAWARTDGRYDPTVLDALEAAGYDRDLDEVRRRPVAAAGGAAPAPGCGGVHVDRTTSLVTLPPGVRIDPGGIGKGLAADLCATEAVADGATAALVSVGGDVRAAGRPPVGGWELEVDHGSGAAARVNLLDGALVTSSVLRRRWATVDGEAHHVVDPDTGRPATGPAASVSVVAATAWWAEAVATAVLVGFGRDDVARWCEGTGVLVTCHDGARQVLGDHAGSFDLEPDPEPDPEPEPHPEPLEEAR